MAQRKRKGINKHNIFLAFVLMVLACIGYNTNAQITYDRNTTDKIAYYEKNQFNTKSNKNAITYTGNNYDLKYHRFNLFIDPDTFYIKGSVKSIFAITKDTARQITFDLNAHLTVDSVKTGNLNLTFFHSSDTTLNRLYINLDRVYTLNQLDSVTVYYQGVPINSPGFGTFVKGYHQTDSVNVPVIWSLSEPYGAKDWWPCKSTLDDKIDSIDMFVTTPSQFRVASNGLLVSETANGSNKTFHWKHRYPIATYLIAVAVTNYAVYSNYVPLSGNDQLQILNYVYPEDTALTQPQTLRAINFMQIFDSMYVSYPFIKEKYGHAEFGWGGGMEHQTMSFLGKKAFNFEIIAHEMGHQWFGDKVTNGDWTDLWLHEGFAVYSTALCYEKIDTTHYWWNIYKRNNIRTIVSLPGGSVYVTDTNNVKDSLFNSRTTYCKAFMVLLMARWIVGDAAFYKALRSYLNDPKLAYGFARTPALKSHLEQASGKDLTVFFNEWFYGQGYPTYNIDVAENTNNQLLVTFNQVASYPSSVSFFHLPVALKFKNNIKDTIIVFQDSLQGQSFNVNLSFHPDSVLFDPDIWLIAKSNISIANSVSDRVNDAQLSVFPNPVNDKCYINYLDLNISKVELIESTGKVVSSFQFPVSSAPYSFDISQYRAGVYFVKVYTDKSVFVRKIIKI